MIPSITYPTSLDTSDNLYEAHDALRVRLANDYNPGDTSITIEGDSEIIASFPSTGLITLTEQDSDIDQRAISFYYSSKTDTQFLGLEILAGFEDVAKPKRITNVTQNVMAEHHNNLKDALIAIETFIGVQGTTDTKPFGTTLLGRLNFLKKLIFKPRAWFTSDKKIGLVPLTVNFTEQCFRTGPGDVTFVWDFGDTISGVSLISVTETEIEKVYSSPGKFDVTLQVINDYGTDTIIFEDFINARVEAPIEAIISFTPQSIQILNGDSIRSAVNTTIDIGIPDGISRISDPNYSPAGEKLDVYGVPIDPITVYTWSLGDDLVHSNNKTTKASYSIGGLYDMVLRADTSYGSYRITSRKNCIDIVERRNLWLFTESSNIITSHEFGLISETFKTSQTNYAITRDDSFLDGTGDEDRAKTEFARNTGFAPASTLTSGEHGEVLLFWAGGGVGFSNQWVNSTRYNAFADTYSASGVEFERLWNWLCLPIGSSTYFVYGPDPLLTPNTNYSNQSLVKISLSTLNIDTSTLGNGNYKNGASELMQHVTSGYTLGEPDNGRFAVYRSAVKDQSGYFLRNDGVGEFFRLKSFYKTEGTLIDPMTYINKLPDIPGSTKLEGQLVNMDNGLFFFNNTGSIAAYNDVTGVWETGGAGSASASFRSLQDSTANNFDDPANTLLAASDGDRIAYLSYDYSINAMIKFNGLDLTFTNVGPRPSGTQWIAGIY